MHLTPSLQARYTREQLSAREAQRLAEFIAWGPVVFQASRLMMKWGILQALRDSDQGLSRKDIVERCQVSDYAAKCLLEASLSIGTVLVNPETDRYSLSKTGWFLLTDPVNAVNMDFNHDVNYKGWFYLEESLRNGKPEGLKQLSDSPTVYEGLSQLPPQVLKSWLGFDHFYSDTSFPEALKVVFDEHQVRTLYDVGGNTGKWALQCVDYHPSARVTVLDLPRQIEMMEKHIAGKPGAERISGIGIDLLSPDSRFPDSGSFPDAIWMSQFLDCFSMEQIVSILLKARDAMDGHTRIYIMETLWDRQRFESATMCLTLTSLYFTAIANGNSKMYNTEDMQSCIEQAGMEIEQIHDGLGLGHSILVVRKK